MRQLVAREATVENVTKAMGGCDGSGDGMVCGRVCGRGTEKIWLMVGVCMWLVAGVQCYVTD